MDGVCVNSLFQASVFFKGFNGKFAKGFFYSFDLPVMCQCFLKISCRFGNA